MTLKRHLDVIRYCCFDERNRVVCRTCVLNELVKMKYISYNELIKKTDTLLSACVPVVTISKQVRYSTLYHCIY